MCYCCSCCCVEVVAILLDDLYVSLAATYHSLFWPFLFCYCSSPFSCRDRCQMCSHLSRVAGLVSFRISLIESQWLQRQVQKDFHLFKWLLWILIFYFWGWNLCFLLIRGELSVKDLDRHFLVFQWVSSCWGKMMNWEQVVVVVLHCANLSLVVIPQLFTTEDFDHGDLCHIQSYEELTTLVLPVNRVYLF